MKICILVVFWVSFYSLVTWAQSDAEGLAKRSLFDDYSDLALPVNLDEVQGGFPEAPINPCPRPSPKYVNLLGKLDEIKAKIKSEACNEADLTKTNLEKLLGEERKKFLGLVNQGLFKKDEQLTPAQVKEVQAYVKNIVHSAAQITGVAKNPACFDEKDKVDTLNYVSSVIGDVSGALGALAGPFGAKLSLGGQLAGDLLVSVGEIVQARETYDYTKIEDIHNYFNNLCTYHDFKAELDVESDLITPEVKLQLIYNKVENFLSRVGTICESCVDIIRQYNAIEKGETAINLQNSTPVETGPNERDTDQVEALDEAIEDAMGAANDGVDTSEKISTSLESAPLASTPLAQLQEYFKDANENGIKMDDSRYEEVARIAKEALQDPSPEAITAPPIVVEDAYVPGVWSWLKNIIPQREYFFYRGFSIDSFWTDEDTSDKYRWSPKLAEGPIKEGPEFNIINSTIRALLMRSWVREQFITLRANWGENKGKDGRSALASQQKVIEKFLIDREAKEYVRIITKNLRRSVNRLFRHSARFIGRMPVEHYLTALQPTDSYSPFYLDKSRTKGKVRNTAVMFHYLFKNEAQFSSILEQIESQSGPIVFAPNTFTGQVSLDLGEEKAELKNLFSVFADAYFIVREKCIFFQHSFFKDNKFIKQACGHAADEIQRARELVKALNETAFVVYGGTTLKMMLEPRLNYAMDFQRSVYDTITQDLITLNGEINRFEEFAPERMGEIRGPVVDQPPPPTIDDLMENFSHAVVVDPDGTARVVPSSELEKYKNQSIFEEN